MSEIGNASVMVNANEGVTDSLQIVQGNLQSYIKNGNDESLEAVALELRRRPGLFGIIFPGRILRESEELTIQKMKDMYKTRQTLFETYTNVMVEQIKNQGQMLIKSKLQGYEGELSQQAMQIQTNLTEFSQVKLAEIQNTFARSRANFAERIDKQMKDAEKYKGNTVLYAKLNANLEKEIDTFFGTIEELLDGFRESLKNKLNNG